MRASGTAIGIAYSAYTRELLREHPKSIDYVEVPFELLRQDPSAGDVGQSKPLILHCSSLNIAGSVPPSIDTIKLIRSWIRRTQTPWLGEHLSFISAERWPAGYDAEDQPSEGPFNLGFTLSPPMNQGSVDTVVCAIRLFSKKFGIPLLLENPPLYFTLPGTTMSQVDFINGICGKCEARLLLDLTHFLIASRNMSFDPFTELLRLPLERVDEVHISGASLQLGAYWDDHASAAPDEVFELLAVLVRKARVRAVTLEYNWSANFPIDTVLNELARTRSVIGWS